MIGKTISHYKILEKLGEGGMGVVYKAEDTKLKRLVALKFLPSSIMASEAEKTRFVHEAQAAAALDHPNICTIHEIDEADGQLFIAMAYVEGQSLKEKIEAGPLKLDEALGIAVQAAEGLQAAHEKKITHRDIKPANIMITTKGQVKIMDFGLAKLAGRSALTKEGMTLGTIAYMSPEQARGESVDHRTDIWSFGVVLYEMITGQHPFKGEYEQAVMYSIMNEKPEPITGLRTGVPMELERIVNKAMNKKAEERYQHINEIIVDLRSVQKTFVSGASKKQLLEIKSPRKKRAYLYGGVVGLLALLIGTGLYFKLQTGERREKIDAIAVLPLANLSGDPNKEFLADGMTEAVISNLGQIEALRVISRTSVMQYKGGTKSLPAIARELNVDAVVEGSVQSSGDQVEINVRLIEGATEKRLWSKSFERELRNVLTLQRQVALAIAGEIEAQVTPQEQALFGEARAVDPEAYKHYILGLSFWEKQSLESLPQAVKHYEQAITIDPNFAQAYAALARPYLLMEVTDLMPKEEAKFKAKQAAAKALELDETLSEAHTAMAMIRQNDWDWSGAEEEFRHAIKLNPGNREAHRAYGLFLNRQGRTKEGLAEMMRAFQLDPLSERANMSVADAYIWNRRYDEAIEHCLRVLQLHPDFASVQLCLGVAYLAKGRYEEAITIFEMKAVRAVLSPGRLGGYLGSAYALSGKREKALKLLDELQVLLERGNYRAVVNIAMIYTGLGEKDKALTMLERHSELLEFTGLIALGHAPVFDPLRSEPRFQALLKKMGLRP